VMMRCVLSGRNSPMIAAGMLLLFRLFAMVLAFLGCAAMRSAPEPMSCRGSMLK